MTNEAEIRRVLESVAREAKDNYDCHGTRAAIAETLERTLLPLLLAGAAMREQVGAPPYGSYQGANWDSALAAAAERLRATQGGE